LDTNDIQELNESGLRWLRKQHRTLTNEEHEDILQDSLIQLVNLTDRRPGEARVRVKHAGGAGALLGKIIDRRAADLIRRKKRRAKVEVPGGDSHDLSVMTGTRYTIDAAMFVTDFNKALGGLSEDARNAFILIELRGLTPYEAARVLDVGVGTVYGRLDAAKAALREEL
jgi:RNA polymerase sigma factor (sigma-70 family)